MDVLASIIVAAFAIGAGCYLTGAWTTLVTMLSRRAERAEAWLLSPDGARADLCSQIPLRDIYPDLMETMGGWFWVAARITPVATDAAGEGDWQRISTALNWLITSVSPGIRVQTITRLTNDVSEFASVHRRNAERAVDDGFRLLEEARAVTLESAAAAGKIRQREQLILIGRKVAARNETRGTGTSGYLRFAGAKGKELLGMARLISLEASEARRLYDELVRERDRFCAGLETAGGAGAVSDMRPVWQRYYERLNPEEAELNPVPPRYSSDDDDNPRRLLCMSDVTVGEDKLLRVGGRYVVTLSLHALPSKTYAGLMETLLRKVEFPVEVVTWFENADEAAKDAHLNEREKFLEALILAGDADTDQEEELKELRALRALTRTGVETVTTIGLAVTVEGVTLEELRRRRGTVSALLAQCWGIRAVPDSLPVEAWAAALPGACELDTRGRDVRSTNAVAMQCWTGSPLGVPASEALMVFRTADGGLVGYHPDSRLVSNAGVELIMGEMGSGKSGCLNLRRSVLAGVRFRQVSFDLNGSATRVCLAAGGTIYRLGDPTCRGFGIFPSWPTIEEFVASEVFDFGMPFAWIADLAEKLSQLATDRARGEVSLPLELKSLLHAACEQVYRERADVRRPSNLDHLLEVLKEWSGADAGERDSALTLRRRLRMFTSSSVYGQFLNSTEAPPDVNSPYIVFDFQGVLNDPVLATLAGMAAQTHVARFSATDRRLKKSFDCDEAQILVERVPPLLGVLSYTALAARKQGVIFSCATQNPGLFGRKEFEELLTSGSIQFFFRVGNPDTARDIFNLSEGETEALRRMRAGGTEYRPAILRTPGWTTEIHLTHGPLDRRLLLGASATEGTEMSEVLAGVGKIPAGLLAALEADALGHHIGG